MEYRDHQPVSIDEFNGLWDQDDPQSTPLDHFWDGENYTFKGSSVRTRDGIGISQNVGAPLTNIRRAYNYPTNTGNDLIVLTYDYFTDQGSIYHVTGVSTSFGPLLTITGMKDFAFIPYAGRGYISPIGYYTLTTLEGTLNIEKGLQNEFLYVYMGDGTAARKAAGTPLSGTLTIANGAPGFTDPGFHLFGFVAETDSGALLAPGALTSFITAAGSSVSFGNVPTSGSPTIVKRHLVATKVITGFNGDTQGYQYFFVPNATINNNTDTFLNNISFYDLDLLDDASHLFDNYSDIPAGASMCLYHDRLVLTTTFDDPSIALVSAVGEPEAISQIDGIIAVPPDGNPITNCQELRDVLYIFKRSKTVSYADDGQEPSFWLLVGVDTALGTCIHGIATVLNSGSSSVDFLIIATYQGLMLFNGKFQADPELSWKIYHFWATVLDKDEYRKIQIVNSPIRKEILIVMTDGRILCGNYTNGMNVKSIRWAPWRYPMDINTIAIVGINQIILGSDLGS